MGDCHLDAAALRLIGEQMELESRSLGPERTTGCLGVVNQCIFRSRRPWGVETNVLNVEYDVETFLFALSEREAPWGNQFQDCLLYTSPSPRDQRGTRMPSSA